MGFLPKAVCSPCLLEGLCGLSNGFLVNLLQEINNKAVSKTNPTTQIDYKPVCEYQNFFTLELISQHMEDICKVT